MKNKKQIISICIAFFSFGLALSALAWTGPTATPPEGNTTAPINTSNSAQTKYGFLSLPKLFDSNDESYYLDPDTNSWLYRLYSYDIRSSIFYDNDDINYFMDPANTGTAMVIAGNVGIGTTAPNSKLHVAGGSITLDNGYSIIGQRTLEDAYLPILSTDGDDTIIKFMRSTVSKIFFRDTTDEDVMTLTSEGNVGIGTTTPRAKLHVTIGGTERGTQAKLGDDAYISTYAGEVYLTSAADLGSDGVWTARSTGASYIKLKDDGTVLFSSNTGLTAGNTFSPTARVKIDNNGNVGIGTAAPGAKLEVDGNIIADAPINDDHLATKAYVDAAGGGEDCQVVKQTNYSSNSFPVTTIIDCPSGYKIKNATCYMSFKGCWREKTACHTGFYSDTQGYGQGGIHEALVGCSTSGTSSANSNHAILCCQ